MDPVHLHLMVKHLPVIGPVLAGTVAGAGATGWAAQAGGWIRHPEPRPRGPHAPGSEPAAER